ncbi:hypothetical protein [Saccharothrix texasensis]|uniref:hypothetical protein n=1 Tax=Saccharothrix texasensis TaxID=103734 RepID=UPI001476F57E|nr:hypothetical protein [Saccharothrix texasensis]
MKRKAAQRQDRVERARLRTVSSKEARAAINRQGREARARMAEQGQEAHDLAATIAPWLGMAWQYGSPGGGDFRHADHRYRRGVASDVGEAAGHARPELRSALEDVVSRLHELRAEWSAWSCKDHRHRSAPHDGLCTSRALFGRTLADIEIGFNEVIGLAMYPVQPDNLYGGGELEKEVKRIHLKLRGLAERLSRGSVARPVSEMRPPRYARLRGGVLERLFRADLDAQVEAGHSVRCGLRRGDVALKEAGVWHDATAALLRRGLGDETAQGFEFQTKGARICKIPKIDRVALGSAHLELGLVYLGEVRERLSDYAEAAGQRLPPGAGSGVRNNVDGSVGNAVQAGIIYGDVRFYGSAPDGGRSG